MNPSFRPKLTYSNVIATIALFVALGGAAVAAGLPKHSVGPKQLKRGAVTAAALRKGAVTSGKLAPKSVVVGKLGANAVLPGNIGNGAITSAKLGAGSVIASTIKNGVITTNKLANANVTTAKLADGSVTSAKLGPEVAPLLGTLRSGQTLRGFFDLGRETPATNIEEGDTLTDSYSFQFPLTNPPAFGVANIIDMTVASPAVTAACSGLAGGNQETPQAAPGNLCVYVTGKSNLGTPPLTSVNGPRRLGFALQAKAASKVLKNIEAIGFWAVTAP